MAGSRLYENRRRESRYYFDSGTPIAWRPDRPGRRRAKGWLNDVSDSGLSFLAAQQRRPKIGETVCVHDHRGGPPLLCRVVRLTGGPGEWVVVGCARDQGQACDADCPMRGSPACRIRHPRQADRRPQPSHNQAKSCAVAA